MDWEQFLEIVAVPAFIALASACAWGYVDLRSSLRFLEKDVAAKRDTQEVKLDATGNAMAALQLNLTSQGIPVVMNAINAVIEAAVANLQAAQGAALTADAHAAATAAPAPLPAGS